MENSYRYKIGYDWWAVLALVVAIYLFNNLVLHHGGFVSTYVIIPMLWCLMAGTVLLLSKQKPAGKSALKNKLITLAAVTAFVQVAASVFSGLYYGFGDSPYSFTATSICQNLIYVTTALLGMELSRAWLINRLSKHNITLKIIFISILYTFISIPLTRITGTSVDLETMQWMNSTFFPAFAESMLASYLVYTAGPIPAIIYRGILQSFTWFCPILPDLKWMAQALIGTSIPIAGLLMAERFYSPQHRKLSKPRTRANTKLSLFLWITTSITVVLMVFFSIGFLVFHPTVIISGSMNPAIDVGDVVVVDEIAPDHIEEGDVIEFTGENGATIVHRVHSIQIQNDGTTLFQTKGDKNDSPDIDLVHPEQVKGKVLYRIPKIGWISITVKQLFVR